MPLEAGKYGGKIVVLNYVYAVYGLWYSGKLFDEKGWEPAEDLGRLPRPLQEIKADGHRRLAHQGKYPYYIQQVLMDLIVKHGGLEVVNAIDTLEPNAFEGNDRPRWPRRGDLEVVKKGLLMPGTEGLDHIQSQTAWNEGKAAFIPSGSWLENEQKKQSPGGLRHDVPADPRCWTAATLPFEGIRVGAAEAFIVPGQGQERRRRPGVPAHHAVQGGVDEVHRADHRARPSSRTAATRASS